MSLSIKNVIRNGILIMFAITVFGCDKDAKPQQDHSTPSLELTPRPAMPSEIEPSPLITPEFVPTPPPPDADLDKKLQILQSQITFQLIEHVYQDPALGNIKAQIDPSVISYRKLRSDNSQINIITVISNEEATALANKFFIKANGNTLLAVSGSHVFEFIGSGEDQLKMLDIVGPSPLEKSLLKLASNGIIPLNIIGQSNFKSDIFSQKLGIDVNEFYNITANVNGNTIGINPIACGSAQDVTQLIEKMKNSGQNANNLFAYGNIMIEIPGNPLSDTQRVSLQSKFDLVFSQ